MNILIRDITPDIVIIGASFYRCCTPYMAGELIKDNSGLNVAAVAIGEFPVDLAMYFIINGVKSYVNTREGIEQFYDGIDVIRRGRKFVSDSVNERITIRPTYPKSSKTITERQIEVIRCICNGFSDIEVADTLAISKLTVNNQKKYIFNSLCIRNEKELIGSALKLGYVTEEELQFYGRDFVLKPVPPKKLKYRGIR